MLFKEGGGHWARSWLTADSYVQLTAGFPCAMMGGGQPERLARDRVRRGPAVLASLSLLHAVQWRGLLGSAALLDSPLLSAPDLDSVPQDQIGLRRGLLHALMRMRATREVRARVREHFYVILCLCLVNYVRAETGKVKNKCSSHELTHEHLGC